MNSQHRAIRALLTTMSPRRAIDYIQAFELPVDEERYLIARDVRRKSYTQISMEYNVSPDCINKKRHRAYMKIADQINHEKTPVT